MAKGLKIDWKQSSMLALMVTAAAVIVQFVFTNILDQTVKPLFTSIPATTPITGTLGSKVLSVVGGLTPLSDIGIAGYVSMFISALAIVVLGELMIDNFKLPTIKNFAGIKSKAGRVMSVILYGSIPVYLLLIGFALPDFMTIVGVAIFTFLVSLTAIGLARVLKLKI